MDPLSMKNFCLFLIVVKHSTWFTLKRMFGIWYMGILSVHTCFGFDSTTSMEDS